MISVAEALRCVLEHARQQTPRSFDLDDALGLVLARDVQSDVDVPPHDKALMDGYAVRADDITGPDVTLRVIEEVTAGDCPSRTVGVGESTRIMTGAPLPGGADAVVMFEETATCPEDANQPQHVRIGRHPVTVGQNLMRRGAVIRRGDVVLPAGRLLRPVNIGLLAEAGQGHVDAFPRPTVAVLATGNELVDRGAIPASGQIRNSNGPLLTAMARDSGAIPRDLGIGRDERDELTRCIQTGLKSHMLVLSGGVSAGVKDLVPNVLAELGVRQVFHKVRLKPGKPLWFGVFEQPDGDTTLVFGLPGNPVSSLVCFWLFARPAIQKLAGRPATPPTPRSGQLKTSFPFRGDRETYYPGRFQKTPESVVVEPLAWQGSADLRTLSSATCLIQFPAGDCQYNVGDEVAFFPFDCGDEFDCQDSWTDEDVREFGQASWQRTEKAIGENDNADG
jgi:molybdopterin molybdotransferase